MLARCERPFGIEQEAAVELAIPRDRKARTGVFDRLRDGGLVFGQQGILYSVGRSPVAGVMQALECPRNDSMSESVDNRVKGCIPSVGQDFQQLER